MKNEEKIPGLVEGLEWQVFDREPEQYNPEADRDLLKQANQNIEQYRKGNFTLQLKSIEGLPQAGKKFTVKLTRHEFPFGFTDWKFCREIRHNLEPDAKNFQAIQTNLRHLNSFLILHYLTERYPHRTAVVHHEEAERNIDYIEKIIDQLSPYNPLFKGHPLFWSIPKAYPGWLWEKPPQFQNRYILDHVQSIVSRYKDKISIWDAINEPLWETTPLNIRNRDWPHLETPGVMADYIEPVLKLCKAEAPHCRFLINDYGLEKDSTYLHLTDQNGTQVSSTWQRKRYLQLIDELGQRGAAPDALGMQFRGCPPSHALQWELWNEMSTSGLPVHITEFCPRLYLPEDKDLGTSLITQYVKDTLTCAFGHPGIEAFYIWDFGKPYGNSHLVKEKVYQLLDNWKTDLVVQSNDEGIIHFRGFFGEYEVTEITEDPSSARTLKFSFTKKTP